MVAAGHSRGNCRSHVFVALDFPSADAAGSMASRLAATNRRFKIGLELFSSAGPVLVRTMAEAGHEIFLDLKFHDIPNTVYGAVKAVSSLGVRVTNVHCAGGLEMLRAAARARDEARERAGTGDFLLIGVTVLTSLDDPALHQIGFPRSVSAQVKHFVELAQEAGLDGVVCSPMELPLVRSVAGPDFFTMVPGIRLPGGARDDQKRVMTPSEAALAGAHALVVGRPITGAADPESALRQVLEQL